MKRLFLLATVALAACTPAQQATVTAATQEVINSGQLFCALSGVLYQANGVSVTGASSSSVASACAALTVAGQIVLNAVPTFATPGQAVTPAAVTPAAAAAVTASKPVAG